MILARIVPDPPRRVIVAAAFAINAYWLVVWAGTGFRPPVTVLEFVLALGAISAALLAVDKAISMVAHRSMAVARFIGRTPLLKLEAPAFVTRGRVRRETIALARDMHTFLKSLPPRPFIEPERQEMEMAVVRMRAAGPMPERPTPEMHAIWTEYQDKSGARDRAERLELAERFGGRIVALLYEYKRRGLLTRPEEMDIDWYSRTRSGLPIAAAQIEALAKRIR